MNDFLVRRFVRDYQQVQDPTVRERYGILSGVVGICLNLLLSAGKFFAGLLEQLGMIRMEVDALVIVNWRVHQNVDGMERIKSGTVVEDTEQDRKKARQREASRRYRDRKRDDAEDDGEMMRHPNHDDGEMMRHPNHDDGEMTRHPNHDDGEMTRHPNHDDGEMTRHPEYDDETMTRHPLVREIEKDSEGEEDIESDSPTVDYQKKLGIDNAYTYSARARAKTADIITQHIVLSGILPSNGHLFDAISEALERGYTVNGVMREAFAADGDLCVFFAVLMASAPH